MVRYEFSQASELSKEASEQLEEAEKMPVICDDDCPALTPQMAEAFREARGKKPYRGEVLALRISQTALEKAKTFGEDYILAFRYLLKFVNSVKPSASRRRS